MNHVGFGKHRLAKDQGCPREVEFARQWRKANSWHGRPLVAQLIPDCTQRDATVAATVIQWLGSTVGMSLLDEVIKRSPEVREYLKRSCGGQP